MKSLYILRHDQAVKKIQTAISKGSIGGSFILMDAGQQADLPAEVYGKRLPAWLLPGLGDADRAKLRPDMLIIEGLNYTMHHNQALLQDAARELKASGHGKVHIVEVGYCSDTRMQEKEEEKRKQHARLAAYLTEAGWTVQPVQPIVLGTTGVVYKPTLAALIQLGLDKVQARDLLKDLHIHGVHTAFNTVCARRQREHGAHSGGGTRARSANVG